MKTTRPQLSAEEEHRALEEAMQELSSQTDALLSQQEAVQNKPKPDLPRKRIVPHTNGAHLDIVNHAPSSIARPVSSKHSSPELIEAHATKSINEPTIAAKNNAVKKTETSAQPIVSMSAQSHIGKTIEPFLEAEAVPKKQPTPAVESKLATEKVYFEKQPKLADRIEEKEEEISSESFEAQHPKEDVPSKPLHAEVDEFEAELHDWSKLAKPSRLPLVILLLVVLILLGAGYAYSIGAFDQFIG